MSKVKTYAVNCNDAWLNTDGDNISGSYVKYADYMALATKLDLAERACAALAAENATLNDKMNRILVWPGIEFYSSAWEFCNLDGNDALELMCENKTPVTDAFMAEIERKAIRKFINSIEHILRDKLSPYDTEEMLEDMRIFLEEHVGEQK